MPNNKLPIIQKVHIFEPSNVKWCGSYIVEGEIYKKVEGKSGATWLVPVTNNPDQIHVDTHTPGSQGYAGRTLGFKLIDGFIYRAQGPWHSNSDSLLKDTGVNLTKLHLTYGVVGLSRECIKGSYMSFKYYDVLYADVSPKIGSYSRIENLAQQLANDYGITLFYSVVSYGGGMSSSVTPTVKESK